MADAAAHGTHHPSATRYALTYVGLMLLTITTFLFSRVDLGAGSVAIAMGIAVTKASLVVLIFMQLWDHRGSPRLALVVALAWLALLMAFVLADVHTRFPLTNPDQNPIAGPARVAPSAENTPAGRQGEP
jgi:cytochrome c oxidase subunit 4